jgi:hypothetical protein
MLQAYGTQDPRHCVLGVPLQPVKITQNIKEKTMHIYDIDIVSDSDEGRTVNVWTGRANNMAEALQDVMDKNKNMLNSKTEGAVMVTIVKQLSKQAEVANFEARAKVEQMSPEMVRLMTIESDVSLAELFKPPVKH